MATPIVSVSDLTTRIILSETTPVTPIEVNSGQFTMPVNLSRPDEFSKAEMNVPTPTHIDIVAETIAVDKDGKPTTKIATPTKVFEIFKPANVLELERIRNEIEAQQIEMALTRDKFSGWLNKNIKSDPDLKKAANGLYEYFHTLKINELNKKLNKLSNTQKIQTLELPQLSGNDLKVLESYKIFHTDNSPFAKTNRIVKMLKLYHQHQRGRRPSLRVVFSSLTNVRTLALPYTRQVWRSSIRPAIINLGRAIKQSWRTIKPVDVSWTGLIKRLFRK